MGIDYRIRKKHCFYLPCFSKSKTNYSLQWKTNFIKKSLLLSTSRNILQTLSPLMCCKRSFISQKQIVNAKPYSETYSKFLGSENHSLQFFFQILLPPKVTSIQRKHFSVNPSFRVVETYFLSSGNSTLLFRALFVLFETVIEIKRTNFERKSFSCQWKPSSIFQPEEAIFSSSGKVFFNECFIPISGDAFFSPKEKILFFYSELPFLLMETII